MFLQQHKKDLEARCLIFEQIPYISDSLWLLLHATKQLERLSNQHILLQFFSNEKDFFLKGPENTVILSMDLNKTFSKISV